MKLQVHFPDLTEVGQLSSWHYPDEDNADYRNHRDLDQTLKMTEAQTQTELAFAHTSTNQYGDARLNLLNSGWNEVARILNWHSYHKGDHPLSLFTKKFKDKKAVEITGRVERYMKPGFTVNRRETIFTFGCGGRVLNGMEDIIGLRKASPKPLTLLRISKTEIINEMNRLWLKKAGYREIESTSLALYYVNGQDPLKYDEAKERAFWEGWDTRKELLSLARKNKSVCEF